jgi:hypothetical protein
MTAISKRARITIIYAVAGVFGLVVVTAIILAILVALAIPSRDMPRPMVEFDRPYAYETVPVGDSIEIRAVARDRSLITRVELWVDGALVAASNSPESGGMSPFPFVTQWQPATPGLYQLTVRAFSAAGIRSHASMPVQASEWIDGDGDGIRDAIDHCPSQPGSPTARGCPDDDWDGVANAEDSCPLASGPGHSLGCPYPSEGDQDGDGVPDDTDACSDSPGPELVDGCPDADRDYTPDHLDECPTEFGIPGAYGCALDEDGDFDGVQGDGDRCPQEPGPGDLAGCPDADEDGIADVDDACPLLPGLPGAAGCPDEDMDGTVDLEDPCPSQPGPSEGIGCPQGSPDADADGVPDYADMCGGEPGPSRAAGCPPPGMAADADGNGLADDVSSPALPLWLQPLANVAFGPFETRDIIWLEIEALAFEVDADYDTVYCYLDLPSGGEETPDFEPLGERSWDIAAHLAGASSRRIFWDEEQHLHLGLRCYGRSAGPEGLISLGEMSEDFGPETWTGDDIVRSSVPGPDGNWFGVTFRICRGSCYAEFAPFPPTISVYTSGRDPWLFWFWEGDQSSIDGFRLYRDGQLVNTYGRETWGVRMFLPCGQRYEFMMTTLAGDIESAFSNRALFITPPCEREVRVTFAEIHTYEVPGDERGRDSVGPIYGAFWAQGAEEAFLDFFACKQPGGPYACQVSECIGYRLGNYEQHQILDIFNWILAEYDRRRDVRGWYSAPRGINTVTVFLGPNDDLVLGGQIMDCDCANRDDTLIYVTQVIEHPRTARYLLRNEYVGLLYDVEVVVTEP